VLKLTKALTQNAHFWHTRTSLANKGPESNRAKIKVTGAKKRSRFL